MNSKTIVLRYVLIQLNKTIVVFINRFVLCNLKHNIIIKISTTTLFSKTLTQFLKLCDQTFDSYLLKICCSSNKIL